MVQESVVKSKRIAAPEFWRFFFFMFACFLHFEEDVYDDVFIVIVIRENLLLDRHYNTCMEK